MDDRSDGALALAWSRGENAAFGEVYRRFAPSLFGTAVALVGERSTAADVVHDTFVRAAIRVDGLRDPERLRAWLFAILRNEAASYHRSARRRAGEDVDSMSERLADDAAGPDVEASRGALAAMVWDAAAGLQPRDREVLELHLRGGLETPDLADALGVSAGHAAVLLSRMRDRLQKCLGALLVARGGRRDCPELDRLLAGWDGRLSLEVRSKVTRHIESCQVCNRRRAGVLTLEQLAPAVVVPTVALPADLHERLVASLAGPPSPGGWSGDGPPAAPDGGWRWRSDGFPRPVERSRRPPWWALGAAAGMAVLAVVASGVVLAGGDPDPAAARGASPFSLGPGGTSSPSAAPTISVVPTIPSGTSSPSATPGTAAPTRSATTSAPVPGRLSAAPGALDLGPVPATGTVRLSVSGTDPVAWTARTSGAGWLVEPGAGTLAPGASVRLTVRATGDQQPEGDLPGTLVVRSEALEADVVVPLSAAVERPPVIVRSTVVPGAVFAVGAAGCGPVQTTVRVVAQDESAVTGVVAWRPDRMRTVQTAMRSVDGGLAALVGPFTLPAASPLDVTVTDTRGNLSRARAQVTVVACRP